MIAKGVFNAMLGYGDRLLGRASMALSLALIFGIVPPTASASPASAAAPGATVRALTTWGDAFFDPSVQPYPYLNDTKKIQVGSNGWWALLKSGQVVGMTKTGATGLQSIHSGWKVKDISYKSATGIVLKGDGTVWAMGPSSGGLLGRDDVEPGNNAMARIPGLERIDSIASSQRGTAYAVAKNGAIYAWGQNTGRVDAQGDSVPSATPVKVPISDMVTAVTGWGDTAYALTRSGRVWAWGAGMFGQLGNGQRINSYKPVLIPDLRGVRSIASGLTQGYARMNDGTMRVWGYNYEGALGLDPAIAGDYVTTPTTIVDLLGVTSIATGRNAAYALLEDGTVKSWGDCQYGSIGRSPCGWEPAVIPELSNVSLVESGHSRTFALGRVAPPTTPRPLLLLHGITANGESMRQMENLARQYVPNLEVKRPDLGPTASIETNALQIIHEAETLKNATKADRVNIIAHSKGGAGCAASDAAAP